MRDFLLDTQMIRYWYDRDCPQHAAVISNIETIRALSVSSDVKPKLLVSIITRGEIEFGHRVQVGDHAAQNQERLRFLREQLPEALEVLQDAVVAYGELRMRLFNKYAPAERRKPSMRTEQLIDPVTSLALQIQENDLWLCAQAAGHGIVFVTHDRMNAIQKVAAGMDPPLIIQDWAKPGTASISV